MNRKWLFVLILFALILGVYVWTPPRPSNLYQAVAPNRIRELEAFRQENPPAYLEVNGKRWEYLSVGAGDETVLFLHGMTGSYDIWYQQIEALKSQRRVIAVTYPAVDSLAEMAAGVTAVLDHEGVDKFDVVGTSLGGYLTQYLLAQYPERVLSAALSNTFPPNDLIKQKNGAIGAAVPYLPEWLVMDVLRGSFQSSIYPASGFDEMTLAFLNEMSYGKMQKAQVAGRYQCVVEKFSPPSDTTVPLLIIEASNDPLVEEALREQLKSTYASARVVTVDNGHFPYISQPEFYTRQLLEFWKSQK
ncbi:MAG: hypothetical protein Fur002_13900 [Anaerolineales bacterium]